MLELIIIFSFSVAAVSYLFVSTRNKVKQPGCCGKQCNCHENKRK